MNKLTLALLLTTSLGACTTCVPEKLSRAERNEIMNARLVVKVESKKRIDPRLWVLTRTIYAECPNYTGMLYHFSQTNKHGKFTRYGTDTGLSFYQDLTYCNVARVTWSKPQDNTVRTRSLPYAVPYLPTKD